MSRVYFHSPSGDAELWGGEHHHLHNLVKDAALAVLDMPSHIALCRELAPDPYPGLRFRDDDAWLKSVETLLRISEPVLWWKGCEIDSLTLLLNTAMAAAGSNNPLRLAARIAGQAEIHCWCEGADRAWLAEMIDEGLDAGTFRRNTGYRERCGRPSHESWEDVTAFLRSRDDEPVVLSYSAADQFPNPRAAAWQPPEGTDLRPKWAREAPEEWAQHDEEARDEHREQEARDLFWGLPRPVQWELGMAGLRGSLGGLRMDPANWDDYWFGNGLSAFDLIAPDYAECLDRALMASGRQPKAELPARGRQDMLVDHVRPRPRLSGHVRVPDDHQGIANDG
jgi:hypothetical protein